MKRVTVRLPRDGKKFLEQKAEEHDQSLSAEIRCRLQRDVERRNEREVVGDIIRLENDSPTKAIDSEYDPDDPLFPM